MRLNCVVQMKTQHRNVPTARAIISAAAVHPIPLRHVVLHRVFGAISLLHIMQWPGTLDTVRVSLGTRACLANDSIVVVPSL